MNNIQNFHDEIRRMAGKFSTAPSAKEKWQWAQQVFARSTDVPASELEKYNPNAVIMQRIRSLETPRIVLYKKIRQYFNGENF